MKKSLLVAGALLVLGAATASAQPGTIGLAWNDCAGPTTQTFACNSNAGAPFTLVGSFTPSTELPEFLGISVDINIQFPNVATVPDWWQHGAGLCRGTTGIATNFDFTSGPFTCLDFYVGAAAGGFAYDVGYGAANRSRLRIQLAVPFENRGFIDQSAEWYAFKVNLLRAKTTGTGSCVGCMEATNVVLDEIQLFQPPEQNNDPRISAPSAAGNTAGYQAGPTPVRNATWGQVKSLYR